MWHLIMDNMPSSSCKVLILSNIFFDLSSIWFGKGRCLFDLARNLFIISSLSIILKMLIYSLLSKLTTRDKHSLMTRCWPSERLDWFFRTLTACRKSSNLKEFTAFCSRMFKYGAEKVAFLSPWNTSCANWLTTSDKYESENYRSIIIIQNARRLR